MNQKLRSSLNVIASSFSKFVFINYNLNCINVILVKNNIFKILCIIVILSSNHNFSKNFKLLLL